MPKAFNRPPNAEEFFTWCLQHLGGILATLFVLFLCFVFLGSCVVPR